MKKRLQWVLCILIVSSACSPSLAVGSPVPTPYLSATPPAHSPPAARIILTSSSMTLIADDPADTLKSIEALIVKAGGVVLSASYYGAVDYAGYASLNAQVPPSVLPDLRRAITALNVQVASDSLYSQDVTTEYRALQERLGALQASEDRLWSLLTDTGDRELADSFTLLRSLVENEIRDVELQLDSYSDRSAFASLAITVNETEQGPVILE